MMINEAESIIARSLLAGEWNNLACAVFLYFSNSHCCQFPLTFHIQIISYDFWNRRDVFFYVWPITSTFKQEFGCVWYGFI